MNGAIDDDISGEEEANKCSRMCDTNLRIKEGRIKGRGQNHPIPHNHKNISSITLS